ELKRMADSVNAILPQQPEAGDEDLSLERIPGMGFDTAYLREEIRDQDSAMTLYRNEVANGSYVGLIYYANKYLPLIQSRRMEADSLLQLMEHP
ncbi:MAG TPA: DUF4142 domain-containing protein, partial [Puia sp.]|nr:DUF4142 domain-containing protein [Puia sp.]